MLVLLFSCLLAGILSSDVFTNYTIVGVFDNKDLSVAFVDKMSTYHHVGARIQTYLTANSSQLRLRQELCALDNILFIYVISTNDVIQQVSVVGVTAGVPVFVYDVRNDSSQTLAQGPQYYMNSHVDDEGNAFAKIAHSANWPHVVIAVHRSLVYDGLVDSFNSLFVDELGLFSVTVEHNDLQTSSALLIDIQQVLTSKLEERDAHATYNIIVLHMPPDITAELLDGADLLFHDRRIIWLVSSTSQPITLKNINPAVVTLLPPPVDGYLVSQTLEVIVDKIERMASVQGQPLFNSSGCYGIGQPQTPWRRYFDKTKLVEHNKLNYYQLSIKATSEDTSWATIGNVFSTHDYDYTALGKTLAQQERQTYTVVTILDRPFVSTNDPQMFDNQHYCQTPSVLCLGIPNKVIKLHGHSSQIVNALFTDFYRGIEVANRSYSLHCCEGLAIDLLQTLSNELDFDFQLYLSPDGTFGAMDTATGNWTGMVKELLDGRADMVAASFSIVSSRSKVIDYSAPYYYSGFSMMASERESTEQRFFSFIDPFPVSVWAMFMAMAVLAFTALSMFEWVSPFGANPKHDRDKEAYTLASGIKTVFSLMSGNTLPCKSPNSWPGKWMQNLWGFFGIIYLSAYTANLTSSITDNTYTLQVDGIYDDQLLKLPVGGNEGSASVTFVETIKSDLYEHMKQHHVNGTAEGLRRMRTGELEVFIHDTAVIDYLTSQENHDCKLYKLGTFSVDSYGSAFPKDKQQNLKAAVSAKYLEYQQSGYIDKLRKIYFPPSQGCVSLSDNEEVKLTVENAAGLFIILIGFIVFSFCLMGFEHFLYLYLIPHAKKKPASSWWRGKLLMFISQRIHRAIMKDGAHGSATVFKNFATQVTNVFALTKKETLKTNSTMKLNFYDVVTKAYETKFQKPFECLYMKGWKPRALPHKKAAHAMSDLALLTVGMSGGVLAKRRYSDLLDRRAKQAYTNHASHSNGHAVSLQRTEEVPDEEDIKVIFDNEKFKENNSHETDTEQLESNNTRSQIGSIPSSCSIHIGHN